MKKYLEKDFEVLFGKLSHNLVNSFEKMPKFELSFHAIEQCQSRGIPQKIVFEILAEPDKIDVESEGQLVYKKTFCLIMGKFIW